MKILEFNNTHAAQTALDAVNEVAAAWWAGQGYTVVDDAKSPSGKRVIGKNALTGEDEPNKMGTLTWDEVKERIDGTFYFTSPADKPQFSKWRDHLPPGLAAGMPNDKDFPAARAVE